MSRPDQKFQLGDRLRDQYTGKVGKVTKVIWQDATAMTAAEWMYSIDQLGWYFVPESDLAKAD